jgi:uridylate kinase
VDGVYTADPKKDPSARRYDRLTFDEAISKGLKVMDMTALTMCRENEIPILVFDFKRPGNIRKVMEGADIGTVIRP